MADQLWFMTCIREEEDCGETSICMPPPGQIDIMFLFLGYLSIHSFICYQTCEPKILDTSMNEPILVQIGTSDTWSKPARA